MSILKLQEFMGQVNIAEDLDETTLIALGARVHRQFEQDHATMTDWEDSVKRGTELMKQEWEGKSTPWENASNYKDPLLIEASIQFGDKAVLELLRAKDLVSAEIIGKDPEGIKLATSERVVEAMNFQINHDMNNWRKKQSRLYYTLPNTGCMFKKTVYDPIEDITESHVIQYPDFAVNQACEDMSECRSFTEVMDFSNNEVEVKVRSGRWLDIETLPNLNEPDKMGDEGSNEDEDVLHAIDNPEKYLEQQTFFDLDDDGYEEPYIVTIHAASRKVVRVVARFDTESLVVKFNDAVMSLTDALKLQEQQETESFGGQEMLALTGMSLAEPDLDQFELIKIEPFQQITKYGFIPAPDGTFLDLGYSHELGAITQQINTSTNQLTDTGTMSNIGGGLLSKEFRKSMGINRLRQGTYIRTEVPADKFAKGIFPNPTQEPSPTLFKLNEQMRERGQRFLAIADVSGAITAQTAPTTALAIIQESNISTSALFKRILDAQSEEFQILFRIDRRTFNNEKYQKILDDPQANAEADFNSDGIDIVPTANAEMSSKMMRIQTAELELAQFPLVLQTGGNPVPLVRNYFESIGSEIIDDIYPEEGNMSPAEQEQLKKMQEAQEQANQIQMMQLQILEREQDRLDKDSEADRAKTAKEIEKLGADIVKTIMDAAKSGEEAETEALNNKLTKYTASVQELLGNILAIGANNGTTITQNNALRPPANNTRTIQ